MKHTRRFICLLTIALVTLHAYAKVQPLDKIIAEVNKDIITQSELDSKISETQQALTQQGIALPSKQALTQKILNGLIVQKLQLQTAKRMHITATTADINNAMDTIAGQRNMTREQMLQAANDSGLSTQDFITQLRQQIILHKLQQQIVASKVVVKPEEVAAELHNAKPKKNDSLYRIEDILIALPDAPTPKQISAANKQAKGIIAQLKKGTDFKTLAVTKSSGQQALQGGDLGWRQLTELPRVFAHKVQTLRKGGIAGPIRAPNGIHVIRLVDMKQGKSIVNPKQRKQQINQMLFRRKFEQQLELWLQELQDGAYIKILDPKLRAR